MSEIQKPDSASLISNYFSSGKSPDLAIPQAPGISSGAYSPDVSEDIQEISNLPEPGLEPTPAGKPEEVASKSEVPAAPTPAATEKITVTDSKGRKIQLDVDFSDREKVRQAYENAHNFQSGFRKLQVERDNLKTEHSKILEEFADLKKNFGVLDEAYQKGGVAGVVDLLHKEEGGYSVWEKKALEKARYLEDHPEERKALEASELAEKYRRSDESRAKELADFKKSVEDERNQAEILRSQAKVDPIFEKYSFSGKLGSEYDEKILDKMLWRTVMDNLEEEYGTSKQDISPETFEDEFRVVSATIRRQVQTQADQKTSRVLAKKKQEAQESVQAQVKSEYSNVDSKMQDEVSGILKSGDYGRLISGWKRYSGAFSRK